MNGKDLRSRALAVTLALLGAGLSAQLVGTLVETIQRGEYSNAILIPSALIGMGVTFLIPWGLVRVLRTKGLFSIPHPENAVGGLALATCLLQGLPELLARPSGFYPTAEVWHQSPEFSHVSLAVNLLGGIAGAFLALGFFKKDRSLILVATGIVGMIPSQMLLQFIGRRFG